MSKRVLFVRCADADLHERIRVEAAHQNVSIQDYALRALRFVVEWDEDERRRRDYASRPQCSSGVSGCVGPWRKNGACMNCGRIPGVNPYLTPADSNSAGES